jgi:DNA-binding CsgD family transcriptional regulator
MDEIAVGNLIERIYDAALEPRLWPDLISTLAKAFGGHAGSIEHEHAQSELGGGMVVGLDTAIINQYFAYYASRNVLRRVDDFAAKLRTFTPIITFDTDSLPKTDLAKTEFYADFMRPIEMDSVMTMGLLGQGESVTVLSVFRPPGRPGFDREERALAERLHPHLIRAFRLGRKHADQLDANGALAAGLDQASQGLVVLDAEGRVAHVNAAAERLLAEPGGLTVLGGRLSTANAADCDRLWQLIRRALSTEGRVGGEMKLRRSAGRAPLLITVSPIGPTRASLLGGRPGAIVSLVDPDAKAGVSEAYLREDLGLTASEARIVHALVAGQSPAQIAEALGVSRFTVRSHLYHTFEKAGVSRQAELVALVSRAGKPAGA